MKEVKITPPEGYEIDKENSTFDCIKFKPIVKKFRDNDSIKINGWFIGLNGHIHSIYDIHNNEFAYNIFATEKQAKSALAMARISQIMANDERFGGVITDEEWKSNGTKYVICRNHDKIDTYRLTSFYHFLAFHTEEQRQLFVKENENLVKNYLMID